VTGGKLNFRDLANSIIKDMIRIQIQQSITKPLSNFFSSLFTKNANGNVYGQNGIVPFANGGIVTKPTVFPFKNGIGIMGEAGAEAILPLTRRNGKLGVEGGGNNTSVVVNVDASGTDVQGNDQQANQLGRLISIAVQSELIKQKRPGGLLTA
jgi:phage-related minor tail protein